MTVQDMTPIIEVERKEGSGEWWSMPLELSSALYQAHEKTFMTEFTFVWDWQNHFGMGVARRKVLMKWTAKRRSTVDTDCASTP